MSDKFPLLKLVFVGGFHDGQTLEKKMWYRESIYRARCKGDDTIYYYPCDSSERYYNFKTTPHHQNGEIVSTTIIFRWEGLDRFDHIYINP